jgi:hypothetical protein
MTELFNDELLSQFIQSFYGYGSYSGQFWFVGMEEGGGNCFSEINTRLNAWANRGKNELEDLAQYHTDIGVKDWFIPKPKLQPTWNKLIRIVLSSNGQVPEAELVRNYQKTLLGRKSGDTCLLELLPLPSPSLQHWLYAQHSQLSYLISRQTYREECIAVRIEHLKSRINQYKPSAVIFYGLGYQEHWKKIAGVALNQSSNKILTGRRGSTLFAAIKHPAAQGTTSEYFHQVGKLIASSSAERR